MNITLLDADTREVIHIIDCPKSPEYVAVVMEFAAKLGAEIARTTPYEKLVEWTVELKIPLGTNDIHYKVGNVNKHRCQGVTSITLTIPRHCGYCEQPQNFPPWFDPLLAVRRTMSLPHLGQRGASGLVSSTTVGRVTGILR
jgi:hypothetical protein